MSIHNAPPVGTATRLALALFTVGSLSGIGCSQKPARDAGSVPTTEAIEQGRYRLAELERQMQSTVNIPLRDGAFHKAARQFWEIREAASQIHQGYQIFGAIDPSGATSTPHTANADRAKRLSEKARQLTLSSALLEGLTWMRAGRPQGAAIVFEHSGRMSVDGTGNLFARLRQAALHRVNPVQYMGTRFKPSDLQTIQEYVMPALTGNADNPVEETALGALVVADPPEPSSRRMKHFGPAPHEPVPLDSDVEPTYCVQAAEIASPLPAECEAFAAAHERVWHVIGLSVLALLVAAGMRSRSKRGTAKRLERQLAQHMLQAKSITAQIPSGEVLPSTSPTYRQLEQHLREAIQLARRLDSDHLARTLIQAAHLLGVAQANLLLGVQTTQPMVPADPHRIFALLEHLVTTEIPPGEIFNATELIFAEKTMLDALQSLGVTNQHMLWQHLLRMLHTARGPRSVPRIHPKKSK